MMQKESMKNVLLPGIIQRIVQHYLRNAVLILTGMILVSGVSLVISEFETNGRGRVYAVEANSLRGDFQNEFQAGLMGVVNGIADMERYSYNTRLIQFGGDRSEVLAGAAAINRRAVYQTTIGQGTKKASELGYYAVQALKKNQISEDEYYTLLQIVEAEVTGGDLMSKMIVAGVVLNRVRDLHFPDTIQDVVWQKVDGAPQFQPTQDGRIYSCEITDTTIEAVDRVLAGEDYSEGALFFFARHSSEAESANWFDTSLVRLFEYGGHEYFTFQDYCD
ncbi:MAG: cell wall hydrolase [Lachnospiraceae bacterium]|nr:cell wall hydrolase [Lachnospiraceae bacterium]